jgi:predicted ribosomally synthesized peptide with SipW-like signal peptide
MSASAPRHEKRRPVLTRPFVGARLLFGVLLLPLMGARVSRRAQHRRLRAGLHAATPAPLTRTEMRKARSHGLRRALSRRLWRVPVVAAAALVLGLGGGTAFAYFSSTGYGTGSVTVGSLSVTVEQATVTPTSHLFPGGKGGLSLKITNPNSSALTLTGVSQDGPVIVTGAASACTSDTGTWPGITLGTSGVKVSTTSTVGTGLSKTINAGPNVVTTVTVPTGATMSVTSTAACQTKTFHVKVTVTVKS